MEAEQSGLAAQSMLGGSEVERREEHVIPEGTEGFVVVVVVLLCKKSTCIAAML
jgi:hypothetical protein